MSTLLFTFSAILIALFSLWAQISIRTSEKGDINKQKTATLGLFWIYTAIICALIALGLFLYAYTQSFNPNVLKAEAYRVAVGFLLSAFIMGCLHIVESIISLFVKINRNITAFDTPIPFISERSYKLARWFMVAAIICVIFFSVSGTYFGGDNKCENGYLLWWGNLLGLLLVIIGYYKLTINEYQNIKINISCRRLRSLWNIVYQSLPGAVKEEILSALKQVEDPKQSYEGKYRYGSYSPNTSKISFFVNDLKELSDDAVMGVMAHELGHAYCQALFKDPSPCKDDIDTGANFIAQAWGYTKQLKIFSDEKN